MTPQNKRDELYRKVINLLHPDRLNALTKKINNARDEGDRVTIERFAMVLGLGEKKELADLDQNGQMHAKRLIRLYDENRLQKNLINQLKAKEKGFKEKEKRLVQQNAALVDQIYSLLASNAVPTFWSRWEWDKSLFYKLIHLVPRQEGDPNWNGCGKHLLKAINYEKTMLNQQKIKRKDLSPDLVFTDDIVSEFRSISSFTTNIIFLLLRPKGSNWVERQATARQRLNRIVELESKSDHNHVNIEHKVIEIGDEIILYEDFLPPGKLHHLTYASISRFLKYGSHAWRKMKICKECKLPFLPRIIEEEICDNHKFSHSYSL